MTISYQSFWLDALASPFGICIEARDVDKVISKLYRDRGDDEALKFITVKRSPVNPNHIWLMKSKE